MSTIEAETSHSRDSSPEKARSRARWFPILWLALLAGISVQSQYIFEDPGIRNVIIHLSVMLAAGGLSLWVILRSGLSLGARLCCAALLSLPVAAHYLQLSPIEFVNNGDVGLVDWRWRWQDPDRELDTTGVKTTEALQCEATQWDYPRFLGTGYWAEVKASLETDWQENPPQELWKQRIGAGWSSFAVVGQLAYTQEQRGDQEMVTCYELGTGELLWSHSDSERFDPRGGGSLGGVGPQATPTVYEGKVYTHGATGIVNCLDALTGKLHWSCNTKEAFNTETLFWGNSASPLIAGDMVVVSVGDAHANIEPEYSQVGNSLVAFDSSSGDVIWKAGDRCSSYATPVLATLAGVEQIVVVNQDFVTAHRASDGQILWEHPWEGRSDSNASSSQPIPVGNDQLFLSKGYGIGAELIEVRIEDDEWSTETVWKKNVMKTKMCNVVIRDGYVYGLDDVSLSCIELSSGKKKWKKRRRPSFGHGQILLAGSHLVVTTEEGEVVLVAVDPEEYQELGSFQAIDGVTWNNPTLVDSKLVVRNAEWAACFKLSTCQYNGPSLTEVDASSTTKE